MLLIFLLFININIIIEIKFNFEFRIRVSDKKGNYDRYVLYVKYFILIEYIWNYLGFFEFCMFNDFFLNDDYSVK